MALEPWVGVAEAAEEPGARRSAGPGDHDPEALLGAGQHGGRPNGGGKRLGVVAGERVDVVGREGDLVGARRPGAVEDLEEPRLTPAERRIHPRVAREPEPVEERGRDPGVRFGRRARRRAPRRALRAAAPPAVVALAERVAERIELGGAGGRGDPPQEIDGAGDVVDRGAGEGRIGGGNGELGVEQP